MKKKLLILTAITVSLNAFAQETLQHFDPAVDSPVADEFPGTDGYYTGHNTYSDEEFAEKYEITGDGTVIGVSAIHVGVDGTSSMNASYKIYEVGGNGLPSTQKASKNVPYTDIPVDGSTYSTMFTNAVSVTDEFFVSFNLGDYVHNDPGTKRIAITHSQDGTRPSSDLGVFGRNAIRWHSHGGADWKDYRTENFQSLQPAVYFSLFPIVELGPASVIGLNGNEGSIGSAFPNPSSSANGFTVPIRTNSGGNVAIQLFDLSGKMVVERNEVLPAGESYYFFSSDDLNVGTYLLLVRIPEGIVSQKVTIQ